MSEGKSKRYGDVLSHSSIDIQTALTNLDNCSGNAVRGLTTDLITGAPYRAVPSVTGEVSDSYIPSVTCNAAQVLSQSE